MRDLPLHAKVWAAGIAEATPLPPRQEWGVGLSIVGLCFGLGWLVAMWWAA
jgi:hypothetical protein